MWSWLLLSVVLAGCQMVVESKPNIVLYVADDLGVGMVNQHAPQYSFADDESTLEAIPEARRMETPTLERLAREGKRFMRSYAGSPVCGPSRHSLMTGIQTGIAATRGNGFGPGGTSDMDIEKGRSTLGKVMKSAGYRTGAFGKWGMATKTKSDGSPCNQGFDYFYGKFMHAQMGWAFPPDVYTCTNPKKVNVHRFPENKKASRQKCFDTDTCKYFDYLVRDKALEFMELQSSEPFFVYWCTSGGHTSLYEHLAKHGNCELKTHPVPTYGAYTSERLAGTGRDSDAIRGLMAMVQYTIDEDMRLLLELLERKGIADNTLIIFVSDNGPHIEAFSDAQYNPMVDVTGTAGLNEEGYKRRLYEGGIRSPTIAWWPGKIPAGTKSYYPFMLYDLPLTLASAAGIDDSDAVLNPFKVANAGGVSLYNLLLANDDSSGAVSSLTRSWVYSEICYTKGGGGDDRRRRRLQRRGEKACPVQWALGKGCAYAYFDLTEWPNKMYKLVKNDPTVEDVELYDIIQDPYEANDLASSMENTVTAMRETRRTIREPLCSVEDHYETTCYPDPCNIHNSKDECGTDTSCKYNRKGRPYKCQPITCSDFSGGGSESECVSNSLNLNCKWVPWLRSRERCVDQFDEKKYANLCNVYSSERRTCGRNKNCRYNKKNPSPELRCEEKSCSDLWRLKSICEGRDDCMWDQTQARKFRCVEK